MVFLHDAGWPAHSIFAEMGTGARMIGVYHGGSAGTRVRLANMLERHVTLRPEVSDGLHALGVPYARINEVTPSVSEGFFRHHHKSHLKSGAPLTIGFVGRPGTPKGIDTAVRSIRYLREKLGPLRFELVGALAPHDDAAITELAERFTAMDVDFAARGRTANADMPQVMLGWDILAFPSREEGCPRTVLEANALGVPVVGITGVLPKKLVDDKTIRSCDRDRFPQTLLTALLEAPGNSRDSVARTHDFGGAQLDAVVDLLPESKPRVKTSPTAMLGTSAELALGASLPVRVRRKWRWLREHR